MKYLFFANFKIFKILIYDDDGNNFFYIKSVYKLMDSIILYKLINNNKYQRKCQN